MKKAFYYVIEIIAACIIMGAGIFVAGILIRLAWKVFIFGFNLI